jgi:hypothetical protein
VGDHGSGDKVSDRTIVVDANQPQAFPAAHGTLTTSFPPLSVHDDSPHPSMRPQGKYVLRSVR